MCVWLRKRDVREAEVGKMNVRLTTETVMCENFDLMPKKTPNRQKR